MNEFGLDCAKMEDLLAITTIENECFEEDAFEYSTFLYYLKHGSYGFFVLRSKNEIKGYVIVGPQKTSKMGEIISIAISKPLQHQGLGQQLLNRAIEWGREQGYEKISLMVRPENQVAQKVYEKNKFVIVGVVENYYGRHEHGIQMVKHLLK